MRYKNGEKNPDDINVGPGMSDKKVSENRLSFQLSVSEICTVQCETKVVRKFLVSVNEILLRTWLRDIRIRVIFSSHGLLIKPCGYGKSYHFHRCSLLQNNSRLVDVNLKYLSVRNFCKKFV